MQLASQNNKKSNITQIHKLGYEKKKICRASSFSESNEPTLASQFKLNGWIDYVKAIWCTGYPVPNVHTFHYQLPSTDTQAGSLGCEYLSKTTIAFALVFFLSLWSSQNTDKRQTLVPEFLVWRKVSTSLRSSHCSSREMAQSSHLYITQNRDNHGFINCKNTVPRRLFIPALQ